jgi:hypothetical protein
MSRRWRRQRRQWRHEGATAPPAPSHASSRAGRPPASASEGGQTGSIGGAPEHGGAGVETLAAGGARHGCQRRRPGESRWWQSRSSGGVSMEAGGGEGRHRSRRSAARATPGASGAREREGRRERWSVGLTDRSAGPIWSG